MRPDSDLYRIMNGYAGDNMTTRYDSLNMGLAGKRDATIKCPIDDFCREERTIFVVKSGRFLLWRRGRFLS